MAHLSTHDLEAWLKTQPKEVSIVIAARSAMRVLPILAPIFRDQTERRLIILPVFRAISISAFAGKWPTADIAVRAASAARTARASHTVRSARSARVVRAAYAAADAVDAANAAVYAVDTVAYAAYAAAEAARVAYAALSKDVVLLTNRLSPLELSRTPLWQDQEMPGSIAENWDNIRNRKHPKSERWDVWIDWYEGQLVGARNRNHKLEFARISIDNAVWRKGPKHVNPMLVEIEERFASKKPDIPQARFASIEVERDESGKFHSKKDPDHSIGDEAKKNRLEKSWEARRDWLEDLLVLNPGQNSHSLRKALQRYEAALSNHFNDLNEIALGIQGERLVGIISKAKEFVSNDVIEDLNSFVASHDAFIRQFPEWIAHQTELQTEVSNADLEAGTTLIKDVFVQAVEIDTYLKSDFSDYAQDIADSTDQFTDEQPPQKLKQDYVNSVNNMLVAIANAFASTGEWIFDNVKNGAEDGLQKGTSTSLKVLLTGFSATTVGAFANTQFAWFEKLLALLN